MAILKTCTTMAEKMVIQLQEDNKDYLKKCKKAEQNEFCSSRKKLQKKTVQPFHMQ